MSTRICDDPSRDDMLALLTGMYETDIGETTEADIEEAIYWFAHDWHGGQASNLYEALCASPFRPSPIARGITPDSAASMLYDELEATYIV